MIADIADQLAVAPVELGSLVRPISVRGFQVTTDKYGGMGNYPIVDQGKALIAGYTSDQKPLPCKLPVTVFGDHTREVKFVAFPFVVGADGTKVLEPADAQESRYLNALIEYAAERISKLGYARHYKELITAAVPYSDNRTLQRRIAAVLDAWDTAVAMTERLVDAKRQRFEWVRDTVLSGRRRLHGFNDEWREVRLADVLHEHGLLSGGREAVFSVSVHKGLVNQVKHLGRSFSAQSTGHYNRVLPGDIVYTKSPTGDFPLGIIKQSKVDRDVIVSPLYGVFTPTTRELGVMLDALFSSPKAAERYLTPLVQKGTKNTIAVTNAQFLQGRIMMPGDDREIGALAELVEAFLREIEVGKAELRLLRHQKRGLMQQLLTGHVRVPDSIDELLPFASERAQAA